jgi:hypothetical protein
MAFEPPKDYIDVATRITEFRARYPEGTLGPLDPAKPYELIKAEGVAKDGKPFVATFIVVVAAAYRTADDIRPGVGMAWEIFPGRTPYTLGSELMNAETSAWGRAIIAVGAADSRKGIASAEEVRNRQAEHQPQVGSAGYDWNDVVYDQTPIADADKGSQWMPPANPRTRKAQRHNGCNGPLPDDQWTTPDDPAMGADEEKTGTSTPDQWQQIAIKLTEKGIDTREGKLAFCSRSANRPINSSKELSYLEAAEIIRKATNLPQVPGPLAQQKG